MKLGSSVPARPDAGLPRKTPAGATLEFAFTKGLVDSCLEEFDEVPFHVLEKGRVQARDGRTAVQARAVEHHSDAPSRVLAECDLSPLLVRI